MASSLLPVHAIDFHFSGFASLTAGSILNGDHQQIAGRDCPCYVANYEYASLYEDHGWTIKPESLIGLQGDLKLLDNLSATAQLVYRNQTYMLSPDWIYLTYDLTPNWSLQAGRKRLPLYAYSITNYIGYSYPWVRPPVDLYGWEVYDYDGANLLYRGWLDNWSVEGEIYGGARATKNNRADEQIFNGDRTHESWNNITGGYLTLSNRIVTVRAIYQYNTVNETEYPPGQPPLTDYYHNVQHIVGTAFNVDYHNFLLRTEFNMFLRPGEAETYAPSYLAGIGYRYRKFTGMFTESWYYERDTTADDDPYRYHTHIASLRWDFATKWAAKMEYDIFRDNTANNEFYGNSQLLTFSINTVF